MERAQWGGIEYVGAITVAVAATGLVTSSVAYGAGYDVAFIGLLASFGVGVTGFGVHVAGREARRRRLTGG